MRKFKGWVYECEFCKKRGRSGGGTTGVACIEAGRNFIGADIDPEAVRVARERCAKAMRIPWQASLIPKKKRPPKPQQETLI